MTLADSSAWIEFLRNTDSTTCNRVRELLMRDSNDVATCGAVRMEILAGARSDAQMVARGCLLAQVSYVATLPTDYDYAAELYRRCRRQGETVRKLIHGLIAALAIRAGPPILHNDRDFEVLAQHTELQLEPLQG